MKFIPNKTEWLWAFRELIFRPVWHIYDLQKRRHVKAYTTRQMPYSVNSDGYPVVKLIRVDRTTYIQINSLFKKILNKDELCVLLTCSYDHYYYTKHVPILKQTKYHSIKNLPIGALDTLVSAIDKLIHSYDLAHIMQMRSVTYLLKLKEYVMRYREELVPPRTKDGLGDVIRTRIN